jgi:hypothetical protein
MYWLNVIDFIVTSRHVHMHTRAGMNILLKSENEKDILYFIDKNKSG